MIPLYGIMGAGERIHSVELWGAGWRFHCVELWGVGDQLHGVELQGRVRDSTVWNRGGQANASIAGSCGEQAGDSTV